MNGPQPIHVLLVEEAAEPRRLRADALSTHPQIVVAGEAGSLAQAIEVATHIRPDVVLLSLPLVDAAELEACQELARRFPESRLLLLGTLDREVVYAAVMAGAAGSVSRDLAPAATQEAILCVGGGGTLLDPVMVTEILDRLRKGQEAHPAEDAFASLSPQEDRILSMLTDGMTNGQIAAELKLAEKTVKNYVSQVYVKLGVERRSQAARLATERRLRMEQA